MKGRPPIGHWPVIALHITFWCPVRPRQAVTREVAQPLSTKLRRATSQSENKYVLVPRHELRASKMMGRQQPQSRTSPLPPQLRNSLVAVFRPFIQASERLPHWERMMIQAENDKLVLHERSRVVKGGLDIGESSLSLMAQVSKDSATPSSINSGTLDNVSPS